MASRMKRRAGGRARCRAVVYLLLAAAMALPAAMTAGCGRPQEPPEPIPGRAVAILEPVATNAATQEALDLLAGLFPGAQRVAGDRPVELLAACRRAGRVLIIPGPSFLPMSWWQPLEEHLALGGATLFVGCDPFAHRVRLVDGAAQTQEELFDTLVQSARAESDLPTVQSWQHLNDDGVLRGSVLAVRGGHPPWPAVTVEVKGLDEWDALVLDDVRSGQPGGAANSLVFFARGGPETSRLVLEAEADDGSHWFYPLTVSGDWAPFVVHEAKFLHFYGGTGRGGAGDSFSLARLRRLSIGLSMHLAAQAPGDHVFGISDVRLAADPRRVEEVVGWPDVPLVSPPYRRYDLRARRVRAEDTGRELDVAAARLQGPLPRALGTGGRGGPAYRWLPLFAALDAQEETRGWPASLYVRPDTNGTVRKWAWVGIDPSREAGEAAAAMVRECVRRLMADLYLYQAGCERFVFDPDSAILVTARCTPCEKAPASLRVVAELYKENASYPTRRVVGPCPLTNTAVEINLGRAPRAETHAETYTVRVSLEDVARHGLVFDAIEQDVKMMPEPKPPPDTEWVTAVGPRFAVAGKPLFLTGINYWPLTAVGRSPGEPPAHWLDPSEFAPGLVRADLVRLKNAGLNVVSIQYLDERQAPQLRFFVDEARRFGIRVHLYMPHLGPLDQDLERARALISAAHLDTEPQVMALDLAWEPRLGTYEQRRGLDPAWRAWLAEQYGSIEHAEVVIGRRLWREEGEVTGPPDEELVADGVHRAAVAVYRRFVDDFVSRRYGRSERLVRSLGLRQLLGARSGFGGSGNPWADRYFPIDLASGATHLDFVCPEAWGLLGGLDRFYEAGFITAYARGVGGDKPVLWIEFGVSVGERPQAPDLRNQARVYENMFELVTRSRAAGCLAWWYPGGWRVDERTDMGVVHPDGSWRPVGAVFRRAMHRRRAEKGSPQAWRGRVVDRAEDARGFSALWDRWRETYRRETAEGRPEEVRPPGFGRRTGELELYSVGGVAFADPAPLEPVNAEWGQVTVDGAPRERAPGESVHIARMQTLRAELINTGAATWDASQQGKAGAVWVALSGEGGTVQEFPVAFVRHGERIGVTWLGGGPGEYVLRPVVAGAGAFGEPLHVVVAGENVRAAPRRNPPQ